MVEDVRNLVTFLDESNYKATQRFPLRKYPCTSISLLINEATVLFKCLFNRNNIFSISTIPSVYPMMFGNHTLNFLRDCFFLNRAFPSTTWNRLFPKHLVDRWCNKGFLKEREQDEWYFIYRMVPFGRFYFVTSRFDRSEPLFTFLSYDSLYFSSFLSHRLAALSFSASSALDLCCGVGVQALTISPFCRNVLGIDLNQQAVELSKVNALVNKTSNCEFRTGNVVEGIDATFDLIVSNPPFIHSTRHASEMTDSFGGAPFGLGMTIDIVRRAGELLNDKGRMFLITRSPVLGNGDYLLSNLPTLLDKKFGWIYHYVADSIVPLQPFEKDQGVKGYRQVILEIYRGAVCKAIRYPLWHRMSSLF